ncbi:MAG: phosphonatase-like hydrolase [Aridibacter famidurans]|nr:phosphonatase-like hydrolase [Aridibacter famidurans]
MNDIRLVVFDMAGTTVRDAGQVADSFVSALKEHGYEISEEELTAVRGASKKEGVARLIPEGPDSEQKAASVYETFRKNLEDRYRLDAAAPVEGAEEVFRWLRSLGVLVALNTGFDRDITGLLISALGWDSGIVDAVVCGDDVDEGRPAPFLIFKAMKATGIEDVLRVANVGDTSRDLEAGQSAGVRWNIGVLSGAHDRGRLESAPHTHILPSIASLPSLFDGI